MRLLVVVLTRIYVADKSLILVAIVSLNKILHYTSSPPNNNRKRRKRVDTNLCISHVSVLQLTGCPAFSELVSQYGKRGYRFVFIYNHILLFFLCNDQFFCGESFCPLNSVISLLCKFTIIYNEDGELCFATLSFFMSLSI